jgi:hypothetical protein
LQHNVSGPQVSAAVQSNTSSSTCLPTGNPPPSTKSRLPSDRFYIVNWSQTQTKYIFDKEYDFAAFKYGLSILAGFEFGADGESLDGIYYTIGNLSEVILSDEDEYMAFQRKMELVAKDVETTFRPVTMVRHPLRF